MKLRLLAAFALAGCGPTKSAPSMPSAMLDPAAAGATDAAPVISATPSIDGDADADAINHALGSSDFDAPTSAPTGSPAKIPLDAPRAGERIRVHYATGGSDNAERDRYEAIVKYTDVSQQSVSGLDCEVIAASMSAFAGRSALHGSYHAVVSPPPDQQVTFMSTTGRAQRGVETEELDALLDNLLGPTAPERALLSAIALRIGEVHVLGDAEKTQLLGKASADIVTLARAPDRDGRVVLHYFVKTGDGGMIERKRRTYELDPSTGATLRTISATDEVTSGRGDERFVTVETLAPEK